ncbi:hypothetical protein FHU35_12680 [Saccharopolyspora dendranthemae]|uniref:Uncharacterized protein n=1 Tax=Saccharopolyspora dendranthemae TaxID=1181886 RepID=A0A561U8K2_9PSEU|nr:hypothetical protein FHU35_12680 [Saccharopolyspora dendranthemae]
MPAGLKRLRFSSVGDQYRSAGVTVVRAATSLVVLVVGVTALGWLYGTENLAGQLLVAVASLPFIGFYLVYCSEHLTPRRWTWTVQFLVALAIPASAFGVPSWLLMIIGERLPGCRLQSVTETEDNRGLRYENDFSCAPHGELTYTSRGDPAGVPGQRLDVLTDPHGLLAAMPVHAAPNGFAWVALVAVTGALVVAVVESLWSLARTRSS